MLCRFRLGEGRADGVEIAEAETLGRHDICALAVLVPGRDIDHVCIFAAGFLTFGKCLFDDFGHGRVILRVEKTVALLAHAPADIVEADTASRNSVAKRAVRSEHLGLDIGLGAVGAPMVRDKAINAACFHACFVRRVGVAGIE